MTKYVFRLFVALVALGALGVVPVTVDASGLCDQGVSVQVAARAQDWGGTLGPDSATATSPS